MLPLQSWANSSNIFMGWLLTQKMVLSLKCVQDNEPRCFPASLPRINLYWRDLLKHSDSAAFPTVLCRDSLRIHCSKRQTCCMWRWAWGKSRAAEEITEFCDQSWQGRGICAEICGVQNLPELTRLSYLSSNCWEFHSFSARLKLLNH